MTLSVRALNTYPIKGCKGTSLQTAVLTNMGLLWDREWMVVKAETGKFISQREKSKLAMVEPVLPSEALAGDWAKITADSLLTVTAPGMPTLVVPLLPKPDAPVKPAEVWEWKGAGVDEGDAAAAWFSQYLGLPCRLLRYIGSGSAALATQKAAAGALPVVRKVSDEYAIDYETRFSDGYPMLMATEASLADLNSRMAEPLPMARFRPNLVLGGGAPWAEDTWRELDVSCALDGEIIKLVAVKPCDRCKVPTINQETGEAGDEPLDTLGVIRSGKALGWSALPGRKAWTHSVFFGWNCVSRTPGRLSVGDSVAVAAEQKLEALAPAS